MAKYSLMTAYLLFWLSALGCAICMFDFLLIIQKEWVMIDLSIEVIAIMAAVALLISAMIKIFNKDKLLKDYASRLLMMSAVSLCLGFVTGGMTMGVLIFSLVNIVDIDWLAKLWVILMWFLFFCVIGLWLYVTRIGYCLVQGKEMPRKKGN